jgi:hypothetical protein
MLIRGTVRNLGGICVVTFALLLCDGCSKPFEPKSATIVVVWDDKDNLLEKQKELTITDTGEMQRLASFFPNLGKGRHSISAAKWVASVHISFVGTDGRVVKVVTNYRLWSEGKGDRHVGSGFAEYVQNLFPEGLHDQKAKSDKE